jgi:hypothetical protein
VYCKYRSGSKWSSNRWTEQKVLHAQSSHQGNTSTGNGSAYSRMGEAQQHVGSKSEGWLLTELSLGGGREVHFGPAIHDMGTKV